MTLLQVEDVHQQFGALKVLNGISLAVPQGQALGVVGPNGAGKTTLIDIVAGGRGRPGPGTPRRPRCHHRLAGPPGPAGARATYQVPRPFGSMTVFENALVAAVRGPACGARPRIPPPTPPWPAPAWRPRPTCPRTG